MPSDLATRSRNLGLDWRPEDNAEYNRLLNTRELRERFIENLKFFIEMKGCNNHEDFAESIGLSPIYIERGLKGVMSYHVACRVAVLCGTNIEHMFMDDLSQDPFLAKQALRAKSA
jgi:hypothetical protein